MVSWIMVSARTSHAGARRLLAELMLRDVRPLGKEAALEA
jgi:hypothetical protein